MEVINIRIMNQEKENNVLTKQIFKICFWITGFIIIIWFAGRKPVESPYVEKPYICYKVNVNGQTMVVTSYAIYGSVEQYLEYEGVNGIFTKGEN